ncbi:C2H2-type zinc finger transcription factor [Phycomyces blakesleeanus NRRL 1555(-)]|uniref:C2H2-type zinc finger transcription factor n=1 Tax=Phycomyces blakesleeanus (strain ATCC 8743b / DSM 1359 / FGSC 10004 / NBRC 33097 / NRRL 1555) TaxID=763407 RepID=A0A163ADD4_PHYB8|nr:C2H2-type zinc finger transcription factor [Phycomyces blakesleeanus NRRL 1555(-)]OAD72701.1 C2H2-type zinc finger transcription factor [Phycomyces blakesleeanus NRRL 1555(-)]|eukprot:XP_018290741.1 C2H2-type zinc finger transcription factor [Phycomyces blakesleeanus NRRL 1555(-)]
MSYSNKRTRSSTDLSSFKCNFCSLTYPTSKQLRNHKCIHKTVNAPVAKENLQKPAVTYFPNINIYNPNYLLQFHLILSSQKPLKHLATLKLVTKDMSTTTTSLPTISSRHPSYSASVWYFRALGLLTKLAPYRSDTVYPAV